MQDFLNSISTAFSYIINTINYLYEEILIALGQLATLSPYTQIESIIIYFYLFAIFFFYKDKEKSLLGLINSISLWFLKLINFN